MKIREVYDPKSMTDIMNRLQATHNRAKPKVRTPEDEARAAAFKATQDAYRDEATQFVQKYTLDQKEQFFNDVEAKFPEIAKFVDLNWIWMFKNPAVVADRNKGLNPEDEWKSHEPLPGSNYTGD